MASLFIVTPVYGDLPSFRVLRDRLRTIVQAIPGVTAASFIVVDDTAGEDAGMKDLGGEPDTLVVTPPYNLGHQGAIVYALREMQGRWAADDIVVTMDADGEDRPEDLPALLAPLLAQPEDLGLLVIARRTTRHEAVAFKLLYRNFRLLFRLLTGTVVRSGNYAAARAHLVEHSIIHPAFDLCYSASLVALPFRRSYVPLPRGRRYGGRSRMGYFRLFAHGAHMFVPFLEVIAVRCILGSTVVLAAFLAALGILLWRDRAPSGGALLLTLVVLQALMTAFASSVILFASAASTRALAVRHLADNAAPSAKMASPALGRNALAGTPGSS